MFISKQDFTTHIYEEAIATISRGDDDKLEQAINGALAQTRRSLGRYDVEAIFALTTPAEKADYAELIIIIKDIAKWNFISVCNAQVDYEIAEKRYNSAVKSLAQIKDGEMIYGWLIPEVPAISTNPRYGYNDKFDPYF